MFGAYGQIPEQQVYIKCQPGWTLGKDGKCYAPGTSPVPPPPCPAGTVRGSDGVCRALSPLAPLFVVQPKSASLTTSALVPGTTAPRAPMPALSTGPAPAPMLAPEAAPIPMTDAGAERRRRNLMIGGAILAVVIVGGVIIYTQRKD